MWFPRNEYWSGLPFTPPGDLPDPGIELVNSCFLYLLHCRWVLYLLSCQWSPSAHVFAAGSEKKKKMMRILKRFRDIWKFSLLVYSRRKLNRDFNVISVSGVSDSLWPHGLQYTRPPCPSPTPRACSNSCPSSRWCHPTISSSVVPFFPTFNLSQCQCLSNESVHIRWPKDWSFSFSISPSNEYSGLISFRTDCFDLLAVQGTLKSLLQHHSSKASVLWHSAFFIVQLSHPYMTTGKTIALTRETFVGKVMSLLFNILEVPWF